MGAANGAEQVIPAGRAMLGPGEERVRGDFIQAERRARTRRLNAMAARTEDGGRSSAERRAGTGRRSGD